MPPLPPLGTQVLHSTPRASGCVERVCVRTHRSCTVPLSCACVVLCRCCLAAVSGLLTHWLIEGRECAAAPSSGHPSAAQHTTCKWLRRACLYAHTQVVHCATVLRVFGVVPLLPCGCIRPTHTWLIAEGVCAAPPSLWGPDCSTTNHMAVQCATKLRACVGVPLLPCGCVGPTY